MLSPPLRLAEQAQPAQKRVAKAAVVFIARLNRRFTDISSNDVVPASVVTLNKYVTRHDISPITS
jgi:hypothetical protein